MSLLADISPGTSLRRRVGAGTLSVRCGPRPAGSPRELRGDPHLRAVPLYFPYLGILKYSVGDARKKGVASASCGFCT
jgi:hypothetical protein